MEKNKEHLQDENIAFLKEKLEMVDRDIPVPHSLGADKLREKLNEASDDKGKVVYPWKRILPMAASFLIVIGIFALVGSSMMGLFQSKSTAEDVMGNKSAANGVQVKGIAYPQSHEEVRSVIDTVFAQKSSSSGAAAAAVGPQTAGGLGGAENDGAMMEKQSADAPTAAPREFSATNTQVKGIDEADIVKTDGEYIYFLRPSTYQSSINETLSQALYILDADPLQEVAKISLSQQAEQKEIYQYADYLVLIENQWDESASLEKRIVPDGTTVKNMTTTYVYDISDKKTPKQLISFTQEGVYLSSRLKGNELYVITQKNIRNSGVMPLDDYIPVTRSGEGAYETVPASCIAIVEQSGADNYTVVSSMNLDAVEQKPQIAALLSGTEQIYMAQDSLYCAGTIVENSTQYTQLVRVSLTEGVPKAAATGKVEGVIDSQFSMDALEGNLRIVTTVTGKNSLDNRLFVLGEDLEEIGSISQIAPGESVYSVRFMEDMAYVVTFKNIDPLFAIDLSSPQNPKILGQLKIPGFSEYLHPVDENTLVGLGRQTIQQGDSFITGGIKLSLFDVSSPTDLKERDMVEIGDSSSTSLALYNHKAVMYKENGQLLGFPAMIYAQMATSQQGNTVSQTKLTFDGFLLYKVDTEKGFTEFGSVSHVKDGNYQNYDNGDSMLRGIYIEDMLYTFSGATVEASQLSDLAKTQRVTLS